LFWPHPSESLGGLSRAKKRRREEEMKRRREEEKKRRREEEKKRRREEEKKRRTRKTCETGVNDAATPIKPSPLFAT
jgi:hypothetical protein